MRCDENGRPVGDAFMLRPGEPYLSVNWLENTGGLPRSKQLEIIRTHLTDKKMTLTAKGRLAVLHLQTVFDHVKSSTPDSRRLAAHHEPEAPHDPSHSGIYGYGTEDQLVADLMAEAIDDHYGAQG
jgi:hypothetical protein